MLLRSGLELALQLMSTVWNFWSSCLSLPRAGITGSHHHKEHSFLSFVSILHTRSSEFTHLVTGRCSNAFWVEGRCLFSPVEILNGCSQLCPLRKPLQLILHVASIAFLPCLLLPLTSALLACGPPSRMTQWQNYVSFSFLVIVSFDFFQLLQQGLVS